MSDDQKIDEALLETDSDESDADLNSDSSDETSGGGMEEDDGEDLEAIDEDSSSGFVRKTYVPKDDDADEELEYEDSAYVLYHKAETGYPCLSFDIITDDLGSGEERASTYPLSLYLISGTQAPKVHANSLLVMKMSKLNKMPKRLEKKKKDKKNGDTSDDDSDDDEDKNEDEEMPDFECAQIPHRGCVNRVRSTVLCGKVLAASWSELGDVHVWDLSVPLQAVNDSESMSLYKKRKEAVTPMHSFSGHLGEGFAVDWSIVSPGYIATGDCVKNIHIWKPRESFASWHVDQQPLIGHTESVEDVQWSPIEPNVLASCSVDKSIRLWDIRAPLNSNCVVNIPDAHDLDINVISWNKKEATFLLSGGDDGTIKCWDLRQLKAKKSQPIATFKHYVSPITSLEWHPEDSTVFAASGADNQITLWDLAVEKDDEEDEEIGEDADEVNNLPPQLLFIHQGQKDIKEVHWHKQIPGLVVSTAISGIDIFRTISV